MDISTVETLENCPVCDGPSAKLGTLGNLAHYRCQDCGIGFNVKELREEAIDLAKGNFANHSYIDYEGDGDSYKIRAIV